MTKFNLYVNILFLEDLTEELRNTKEEGSL